MITIQFGELTGKKIPVDEIDKMLLRKVKNLFISLPKNIDDDDECFNQTNRNKLSYHRLNRLNRSRIY